MIKFCCGSTLNHYVLIIIRVENILLWKLTTVSKHGQIDLGLYSDAYALLRVLKSTCA